MTDRTCSVQDCERLRMGRQLWCNPHYQRFKRNKNVDADAPIGKLSSNRHRMDLWSQQEDYFILDNPELTAAEAGIVLKRTKRAVSARRHVMRRQEDVSYVFPHKNPHRHIPSAVGKRRLVARTCVACGILYDASWFLRRKTKNTYNQQCRSCANRSTSETPVRSHRNNSETLAIIAKARAVRSGSEWTTRDMEVVSDPDMSLFMMAIRTQRTIPAVSTRRVTHGLSNSMPRLGDPTEARWVISWPDGRTV